MDERSEVLGDAMPGPASDAWREGAAYDVVVVGAGLSGLATAYLLATRGLAVVVLEARRVGAVATGNTTGKVSLLQGTSLSVIRAQAGAESALAYVQANEAGQQWLLEVLPEGDLLQRRDAWTYAVTQSGRPQVTDELSACREAGLPVEEMESTRTGLPFPTVAAVRLVDQAQVHAGRMLRHLWRGVREAGGEVVEGVRVRGVDHGRPCVVSTDRGSVQGATVVLATGTPILDRGLHFSMLEPKRSYGSAYRVSGEIPLGMYLSADSPTRSLRTAPTASGELLVVGGNGHPVGKPDERGMTPSELVADLDTWTRTHFPGAERTHRWSAQDYRSPDGIPYAGPIGHGQDNVLVACGYNKWGMTNGAAAALALAGRVVGEPVPWAGVLEGRGFGMKRAKEVATFNATVAARLASGLVRAETTELPDAPPEGTGVVGRDGVKPVAVSTVDGVTRRVSGQCTHLGGVLEWNDAECTWDCPLHGSRFAADGAVLEGPATSDLEERT